MLPRTWFYLILLFAIFLAACQPIRAIDDETTPAAAVPATSTTGQSGCPRLTGEPLDLIIAPNWQQGESQRYRVSYSRTSVEEDEEQPTLTTSYAMSVTVLEASEAGYLMEWQYIAMLPVPRKVRLIYEATPYGEFVALRNLAELQDTLEAVATQLLLSPNSLLPARGTVAHRALMKQAASVIASDVQAFHAIYGLYFTEQPIFSLNQETLLPVIDIRGTDTFRISLMRYGAAKGCLNLFISSEWQADIGELVIPYTVETSSTFDLDLNTGWPKTVRLWRTNIMDGEGQVEYIDVTHLPPAE